MSDVIKEIEKEQLRSDELPEFGPGDTIKVLYLVREGAKERIQAFEGVCIARKHGGVDETFTVRKISSGIGVERIFPLNAPTVSGVEVVRRGRVRRAKLYYLRGRRGRPPASRRNVPLAEASAGMKPDENGTSRPRTCSNTSDGSGAEVFPWQELTKRVGGPSRDRSWLPRWCLPRVCVSTAPTTRSDSAGDARAAPCGDL